jgi:hypothetical protein
VDPRPTFRRRRIVVSGVKCSERVEFVLSDDDSLTASDVGAMAKLRDVVRDPCASVEAPDKIGSCGAEGRAQHTCAAA